MRADIVLLGIALLAIASAVRWRNQPRPIERALPATATCLDCDGTVRVLRDGRCGDCGSSSVVVAWSYGSRLILRDRRRKDSGRFLRGGTPERRRV